MNKLGRIIITFFCLISIFSFCSCGNNNEKKYLDISVYYDNTIMCYDETNTLSEIDQKFFTNEESNTYRYNQIVFSGNPKWTYGLFIEQIEFDIYSTEDARFDMNFKMSNLKQSENIEYNEFYLWYFNTDFYIEMTKDEIKHKTIKINETIGEGPSGFAFTVDKDSTLALSDTLQYRISNIKIIAYHK